MPLLANPALSAALLQLLLQNQAKAQQVPPPLRRLSDTFLSAAQPVLIHPPPSLTRTFFPPTRSLLYPSLPLASLSGKSSSVGSGAAQ